MLHRIQSVLTCHPGTPFRGITILAKPMAMYVKVLCTPNPVQHRTRPCHLLIIFFPQIFEFQMRKRRRCRALYDCNADNDDELEFKENEIIIVLNERTDDENWMYGEIEGTSRRGMFPVSFVSFI